MIRALEQIIEWRGKPQAIRCDNCPEYISGALLTWAEQQGIRIEHIQPGKPQQNAMSNATTEPCVTPGLHEPCSTRSSKCRTSPPAGSGLTTTSARTWHSVASHRCRNWRSPLSSTFAVSYKWGDYQLIRTSLTLGRARGYASKLLVHLVIREEPRVVSMQCERISTVHEHPIAHVPNMLCS